MSRSPDLLVPALLVALAGPVAADPLGLGRAALPEEVAAWDVAVLPDGRGLPEGQGDVLWGEEVFADKCASCHGEFAEGIDSWPVLAGGLGTLTDPRPVKTIGSYWPYLSTVFDYVHRSMPFGAAQTVTADETYAITAYLLYSNGLVEDDFVLTRENFAEIVLPNAGGFYPDDRPETEYRRFSAQPCMADCRPAPSVTKRAIEMNVTPEDPDGRPAGSLPDMRQAAAAAAEPQPQPEPAAHAAADRALVAEGEKAFRKCAACHKVGANARNGTGPVLNGILGAPAGAVEGFKYSNALMDMAAGGLVWDEASLAAFLENPRGFMKGTKMSFAGLRAEGERTAIVAYLASLGN